jgi:thymidylate kinase
LDAHPLLRNLFAALERRGLRWVLLRVPENFARPAGDVDLLVAPECAQGVVDAAETLGFVPLPGWESPPGLILISYERESDQWIVLDVATSVSFRVPSSWELQGAAQAVLSRRRLHDGVALPDDDDAFWLLLGHCLLDERAVPVRYRERLRHLAVSASGDSLGRAMVAAAEGGEPSALREAVLAGDWSRLELMRAGLVRDLTSRRSRAKSWRTDSHAVLRWARKPLLFPRRRGVSIALLGPNGVGKSTLAVGLKRGFPLEARVLHMGIWKRATAESPAARLVEILARPFRLWAISALAHYHQARGRLVIYDRYVYEAGLPPKPPLLAAKRVYFGALARLMPRPDAAVVLDVPGDIAYQRKQENPPDELESERRGYAALAAREPHVELVDASRGPDAVRADVMAIIWKRVRTRWRRERTSCGSTAV